ncbi:MAG TPA: S8 family peptidase [Cyclobacteriaceae bacterium]
MYLAKQMFFAAFFALLGTMGYSQAVLSPALLAQEDSLEPTQTILSISVRDPRMFEQTYSAHLVIHKPLAAVNCFLVTMPAHSVFEQLKHDTNILFIDLLHRRVKPEAALDFVNPAFNRITQARTVFPLVRGAAHNISIKELSFDPNQIDIVNRTFTTPVSPSVQEQHATNMAILIGGGGNSSYRALGVAPQARLTSSDFQNLFPDEVDVFIGNRIYVQNHSYGAGIENYYGNEAFAYDQQASQQTSLMHIFSAGNKGTTGPTSGPYATLAYANLTGNFKQAKNVLVVTAVDSTLGVNALNSRGPAYDGRLKPELTAYGQGGTSDAAAIVSGIATLVQEKYEAMQAVLPATSLVKAVLIATAEDIGSAGIDFTYGYGSVNAYKALKLVDLGQYALANLTPNDAVSIPIKIPPGVAEIRIAICWTDPAALPNSSIALVNDIDSQLEFGTDIFLPWVLSTYPHIDSIEATPKRKADHLNTTEYITQSNPAPGTYTLKLSSGPLSTVSQSVSVAYWMTPDDLFSWDFPLSNDVMEGGASNLLVWEAQPGLTGDVYVQLNQGEWLLVAPSQSLDNYLYWETPDTLAHARLKMQIGSEAILSEEFLISPLIKLNTAFICTDSLGVSWNAVSAATEYKVYTMGTQYLAEANVTSETLKVFSPSGNLYYAVAPVLDGAEGLKSETINYTLQGASCFLNSFSAIRLTGTNIHIQLRLSSMYQISLVKIYKTVNSVTEVLTEYTPNELLFDYDDSKLVPGTTMAYEAEITFNDGKTFRSDVIYVPIEKVDGAILYPNPVSDESDLNILSAGSNRIFMILDGSGRKVYEGKLQTIESSVDIINLPAGIYFYKLLTAGMVTDAGRFIKY